MDPAVFHIGDVPVRGRLILAPMDGFSDLPFRSLCRAHGSALSYTAFVGAAAVLADTEPARRALDFEAAERPVVFQLFDDDEQRLLEAALRLMDRGPDIVDVNMGCSARCVAGRGAGAGLLRDPGKIASLLRRLSAALPVPVTAKIRLGWDDDSRNYLDVARAVEDGGARLLAVHGRTKAQGYTGRADWGPIGEIKAALRIPVVGNGDVASAAEAEARRAETGCDAVMIGRAAMGNPWIFGRRPDRRPSYDQVVATIRAHLRGMQAYYGRARGPVLFRKHLARYLDHLGPDEFSRRELLTAATGAEVEALLDRLDSAAWRPPALRRPAVAASAL
jgi:nifR3 family TIM-barrel protein